MASSDPLWLHVSEEDNKNSSPAQRVPGCGKGGKEQGRGILFGLLFLLHESSLLGAGKAEDNFNQGYQDDFSVFIAL